MRRATASISIEPMRSSGMPTRVTKSAIFARLSAICCWEGGSGEGALSNLLSEGGLPELSLPGGAERVGPGAGF
jgi:hypothetical protein